MKRSIALRLAILAVGAIGATAVNGLDAQNKAPGAYAVLTSAPSIVRMFSKFFLPIWATSTAIPPDCAELRFGAPQPIPFHRPAKPRRCYIAPHESRRNRRSRCQAAAGSTCPLPPLVRRIQGGPHRLRGRARLYCDQTWPLRRPHVCRIEKARKGAVSKPSSSNPPLHWRRHPPPIRRAQQKPPPQSSCHRDKCCSNSARSV